MSHYINRLTDNDGTYFYQYHRRSTGRQYEDRTMWGDDLGQARVFTTKGAAKRSSDEELSETIEVELVIKEN